MIEHLVLFKLSSTATDEATAAILDGLRALPARIEAIRELSCGRNFSPRGAGYELALRVLFESRADLEAYGVDPAHVELVETWIKPHTDGVVVADYETG